MQAFKSAVVGRTVNMISKKTLVIVIVVHLCVWLCLSVCACKGLSLVVVGSWHGGSQQHPPAPTSSDTNFRYWPHQADREPGLLGPGAVLERPRTTQWDPSGQLITSAKKRTGGDGPPPPVRDLGIGCPTPFPRPEGSQQALARGWTVCCILTGGYSRLVSPLINIKQWTLSTQLQDLDFADDPAISSTNVKDLLEKKIVNSPSMHH